VWRIFIVASATHYAELKKIRHTDGTSDGGLVAFGDPSHSTTAAAPSDSPSEVEVRRASEGSPDLGPLPFARQEVEAITALFGKRAIAYLGPDATEARAKATVNGHSYVHFACHAVLDEALPLNSALVLSGSETAGEGEDNGLLQVWEIFDTVRLDAKLVTLSGCQTALGEDMGGEGLMSLTRAFQYAGARSVLASLWRVPDQSTADLMVRFYGHLKTGHSKVEALRLAQTDLIRSGTKAAHPARWAAFALFGDSR
jgi:CHAT domain-containing protein